MTEGTIYVSITGLALKRPWHLVRFYWHAVRSLRQARTAPGNLATSVKTIDGVHHTLTVWESKEVMRRFLHSGAHQSAIRAFRSIATGKTFGFETDRVPSWSEVQGLWRERGKDYGSSATNA